MKRNTLLKLRACFFCPFAVVFLTVLSAALVLLGIFFPIGMIAYETGLLTFLFPILHNLPDIQVRIGIFALPDFLNIPAAIVTGVLLLYAGYKLYFVYKNYILYLKKRLHGPV